MQKPTLELVLCLALALAPAAASAGQERAHVHRLSGALPEAAAGDVSDFQVAPGDRWVVYRADATLDGRRELYGVPTDGSRPPVPLCDLHEADEDVFDYRITPDGQRVIYRVVQRDDVGTAQLFSVSVDGSAAPVRLNDAGARAVLPPEVSLDGRRVVFGQLVPSGAIDLFSVPADGSSAPVRLNPPPLFSFSLGSYRIAPDSTRVVYSAREDQPETELYSVPIDGGPSVLISGPLILDGNVSEFLIAPDAARVVYRADATVNEQPELFVVPIDGGAPPLRLNAPLGTFERIESGFGLDPSGARIAYLVTSGGTLQLHSAPLDGSAGAIRLDSGTVAPGVRSFSIAPAGGRVLYTGSPSTNVIQALFSVPLDGSAPAVQLGTSTRNTSVGGITCDPTGQRVAFVRTNTSGVADLFVANTDGSAPAAQLDVAPWGGYDAATLQIHGTRVVYTAIRVGGNALELFSAPLDASAGPIRLFTPRPPLDEVQFDIRVAGERVLFRADSTEDDALEMTAVPLDGSATPTPLDGSGARMTVGDVQRFALAGRNAVYLADQDQDGVPELFSAGLDRGGLARKLNAPLPPLASVRSFLASPHGARTAFLVDAGPVELFAVPSDGSSAPRRLDLNLGGIGVLDYRFTPDGRWIVFLSSEQGRGRVYGVPSDGSAPARVLLEQFTERLDFVLSPDSSRAVIRFGFQFDHHVDLWSVPLDGSASAVHVTGLQVHADISDYGVSADSLRILYRADADFDDVPQLFSVPIAGGASPVPLQPPGAGALLDFGFPAGSGRVLYRAYGPQGRVELFSSPADGSAPAAKIVAMQPFRRVRPFVLSPDGSRVLYRADANVDERFELFSMPSDGSAPPVQLSVAPRADTDVPAFEFTPDSRGVLFLSDVLRNEQHDLYFVPADRSAPPRRLNPSLAPQRATVLDFEASPDGRFVVYRSNLADRRFVELYRVPLDGSAPPVRASARLVEGGDVRAFQLASDDELVYVADQEQDEVFELFASSIGDVKRTAPQPQATRDL